MQAIPLSDETSGNQTPLPRPDDLSPIEPAWDPSSRTPLPFSTNEESHSSLISGPSTSASTVVIPQSPLDRRLLGIQLQAEFISGEFVGKEKPVWLACIDGGFSIRHKVRNRHQFVEPKDIQLKHPTAQRGNGLLVILEGDHCGKYARRIHHHREEDGKIVMEVAVVIHSAGQIDSHTGEILRLSTDMLGMGVEDNDTRKQNTASVSSLRDHARDKAWKEYRPNRK